MLGHEVNLRALVDRQLDINFPGGSELLTFCDAVLGPDPAELDKARTSLAASLGPAAVPAASIIAATFTKNDRVANGTGIPAEPRMMEGNEDIQELLELKKYKSAINTFRHM
ncbi:hypothetical protein OAJ93_00595 [Gammaproteobacteria bacterium]|nr:hypothetical protein [Gammaproteobacteria bacterium]